MCAFEAACVDEMVTLRCHVVMVESEESAALNSERDCNEEWGYGVSCRTSLEGGLMTESNRVGGVP
jgi:hypothetical protein